MMGDVAAEHREIVEIVPSGEDLVGGQAEVAAEFQQGGSFVEPAMGKAEVHGVALIAEVGPVDGVFVHEFDEAGHSLLGVGDDARGVAGFLDPPAEATVLDELADFRDTRAWWR